MRSEESEESEERTGELVDCCAQGLSVRVGETRIKGAECAPTTEWSSRRK